MSTAILNVTAQTFLNSPVTISLSGLIKSDALVVVKSGDAQAFGQNVTYIPPLDFHGTGVIECDITDGNKVLITVNVLPQTKGEPEVPKIRRQVRRTTMAGRDVEDRFWTIEEDSGAIEGPAAAFVPLEIKKVTSLTFDELHPAEEAIRNSSNYFATVGAGSWIQVDLGHLCNVSEMIIKWHTPCNFSLAISNDRKNYVNAYQGRGVGISNINMPKIQAITLKISLIEGVSTVMEIDHIEVKGSPIAPKATATGAQAVLLHSAQISSPGQLVMMDGSQSRGDVTKFVWSQDSGPPVQLFNGDTRICSFIAPEVTEATTFQFSLTIVDRNSQYSKAEALVHVTPKQIPNIYPPNEMSEVDFTDWASTEMKNDKEEEN